MKYTLRVLILALLVSSQAHGIVMRHDVSDAKFIELGSKYSASVAYIGGCMATLVEPNWLLSAAHCIEGEAENLKTAVHLDVSYRVQEIFPHPDSDIVLIKLEKPVLNGSPVSLYSQTDELGQIAVLVGNGEFGNGREGALGEDGNLRGATNTVVEDRKYNLVFLFDTPEAGTNLEGISGSGDSGGPAFFEVNGSLYVAGVSAYQKGNGFEEGHYGVKEYYSRVSTHYSWLKSIIEGSEP